MRGKKYRPVLCLKPTQFSVGLMEVEYKVLELKKLKPKALKKLIDSKPVPVVISPWKEYCIVDHHHFVFACWHADIDSVKIEIVKDYSKSKHLSYHEFWKKMQKQNFAYLYDQFGEGPRSSLYLPPDIRGMADDPYRSLAWMIRKEGGFENSDKPFAEFQWADFFRSKRLLESHGRSGLQKALQKGLRILKREVPKNLPGAITSVKTLNVKKKSKFVPKPRRTGPVVTSPD